VPGTTPPTDRVRVRRHAERGRYDRATIDAILDEALLCHLGVVVDGAPHVIPTMYARVGDTVYVHGAMANRALILLRKGSPLSLVVTLLDGLVMARSAFNHSMNYRSVVVVGTATEVIDETEKLAAMAALVEHVAPGRWADTRQPNEVELKTTVILAVSLAEASAKVREGGPIDDPNDLDSESWAGVIPLQLTSLPPIPAADLARQQPAPGYARHYSRRPPTQ
jgi:nitroimidazol reductase NimA-like FMN-containing flavoprotein (pyridoxamine 5'-phosphate oxidase superfamily)